MLLLLAATTTAGVAAVLMPQHRWALAASLLWPACLAFALLPRRRVALQAMVILLVAGGVTLLASTSGETPVSLAVVQLTLLVSTVVATGVFVRRLNDTLRRRTVVAEAVAELGHRALGASEPDELLSQALRVLVDVIGADYGTALRQLPDGRSVVAAELGPDPIAPGTVLLLAASGSYVRRVIDTGWPFVSEDLSHDDRVSTPELLVTRGVVSGLAVPVLGSQSTLGVLAVHSCRRRRYTNDEVVAATALASVVATAWERATHHEEMSHQAMHDPLTGLPNRALFFDRLQQTLSRRPTDIGGAAVLLVDLDDFKSVNDRFGHHTGDAVLSAAASRFLDAVRPEDTVARLGGDEFAVLCQRAPDELAAARVARRVQAAVGRPSMVEGQVIAVTASVGIALAHRHSTSANPGESLLREADAALYAAKRQGRGLHRLFDERLQRQAGRQLQLESELRRAVDQDEFVLHYQPIRSADNGCVLGLEALLRWQHPDRGLILPDQFIASAERTGVIVPLGRWVLRTACAQLASWQRENAAGSREPLWTAVNVSPRQLDDPGLPHEVRAALSDHGLTEGSLRLELTETYLLDDGAAGLRALTKLRECGAVLVLDDFGKGYSALTHLTRFPIGAVKVDGSFVGGLDEDTRDSVVVSAVTALGVELGVDVIVDRVETAEQMSLLQSTGCYGVQGFFLDSPSAEPSLTRQATMSHVGTQAHRRSFARSGAAGRSFRYFR